MNIYDKEELIIKRFQEEKKYRIGFEHFNIKLLLIYRSICYKKQWKKWINTSGKNQLPPDFYNEKLRIMMDVMRIDDHSYLSKDGRVINKNNQQESKILKEMIQKNSSIKTAIDKGNVHIIPFTGTVGRENHNYKLYVQNFKRVISKHIEKIENYKKNHTGYKTIFFIFDESTPYMKLKNCPPPKKPGDLMYGSLHEWWKDYNMLEILKNSNIDYIIWYTPYKLFNNRRIILYPLAMLYDVKKIKYKKTVNYDINELESMEF